MSTGRAVRKAVHLAAGAVYWPIWAVAVVFLGLAHGLYNIGGWVHDVTLPPEPGYEPVAKVNR